jgi:hypothetical protein
MLGWPGCGGAMGNIPRLRGGSCCGCGGCDATPSPSDRPYGGGRSLGCPSCAPPWAPSGAGMGADARAATSACALAGPIGALTGEDVGAEACGTTGGTGRARGGSAAKSRGPGAAVLGDPEAPSAACQRSKPISAEKKGFEGFDALVRSAPTAVGVTALGVEPPGASTDAGVTTGPRWNSKVGPLKGPSISPFPFALGLMRSGARPVVRLGVSPRATTAEERPGTGGSGARTRSTGIGSWPACGFV